MLQASVVALGFGMPLGTLVRASADGLLYTVAGIFLALALGIALGRRLRVDPATSLLVSTGTAICGGSAIAAVGPAIGARAEAMSAALATVFVLNAVALYLFPPIGHLLGLSETQFGIWAAIAIHDTSSVVGAAAMFGTQALETATVLKLARALWIAPVAFGAAVWQRRTHRATAGDAPLARPALPWFIAFFLLAALLRTALPTTLAPALDLLARLGRGGLVLALFLIGAGLSRATVRAIGARPFVQGVVLWLVIGGLALLAVVQDLPPGR